ncbi:MAG: SH3 domain-containing protein [Propionibacteriaceae bacterium]|nr:SH3 domain-containing protein [Propionibacteriaceae bacterium]
MSIPVRKLTVSAALAIALSVAPVLLVPGVAHAATGVVATGGATLTIRSAPTTASSRLGKVPNGTAISLTCKTTGANIRGTQGTTNVWNKITYAGKTGYVSAAYVRGGTAGSIPACDSAQPGYPTNPHEPSIGPNGGYTPSAWWLKGEIEARFPGSTCNTYASSNPSSDHRTGNALDCWGELGQRRAIANWIAGGLAPLKAKYVIHEQKIFTAAKPYWRLMEDRGNPTANHYDHVHVSVR